MKEKNGYVLYYDLLNIGACFGVVLLHCTGTVFEFRMDSIWLYSLVVQIIVRWSVPIFFMLTGATLLNYTDKYSTKTFFKKRFSRIFVPFLCWSTLYFIIKMKQGTISYQGVKNTISLYLNNGLEGVFWFFYPLFAIYLSLPILQILKKQIYKKYVYYIVGVGVAAYGFLPLLSSRLGIAYNESAIPPVVGGYVIYVLTGWQLSREVISKNIRRIIYIVGILCAAVAFTMTLIWSIQADALASDLFEYTIFTTYFMSVAVFVWFRHKEWRFLEKKQEIVRTISSASFGIYLIHILFVNRVFTNHPERTSIGWMTASAVGIYSVSLLVVLIGKKIPVCKWLFP